METEILGRRHAVRTPAHGQAVLELRHGFGRVLVPVLINDMSASGIGLTMRDIRRVKLEIGALVIVHVIASDRGVRGSPPPMTGVVPGSAGGGDRGVRGSPPPMTGVVPGSAGGGDRVFELNGHVTRLDVIGSSTAIGVELSDARRASILRRALH